jgi:hypothetical protein
MQILPILAIDQTDTVSTGEPKKLVASIYQLTGRVNDLERN